MKKHQQMGKTNKRGRPPKPRKKQPKCTIMNLCLGLTNKNYTLKNYVLKNKIDICNMQEIDTASDCPNKLQTFPR